MFRIKFGKPNELPQLVEFKPFPQGKDEKYEQDFPYTKGYGRPCVTAQIFGKEVEADLIPMCEYSEFRTPNDFDQKLVTKTTIPLLSFRDCSRTFTFGFWKDKLFVANYDAHMDQSVEHIRDFEFAFNSEELTGFPLSDYLKWAHQFPWQIYQATNRCTLLYDAVVVDGKTFPVMSKWEIGNHYGFSYDVVLYIALPDGQYESLCEIAPGFFQQKSSMQIEINDYYLTVESRDNFSTHEQATKNGIIYEKEKLPIDVQFCSHPYERVKCMLKTDLKVEARETGWNASGIFTLDAYIHPELENLMSCYSQMLLIAKRAVAAKINAYKEL